MREVGGSSPSSPMRHCHLFDADVGEVFRLSANRRAPCTSSSSTPARSTLKFQLVAHRRRAHRRERRRAARARACRAHRRRGHRSRSRRRPGRAPRRTVARCAITRRPWSTCSAGSSMPRVGLGHQRAGPTSRPSATASCTAASASPARRSSTTTSCAGIEETHRPRAAAQPAQPQRHPRGARGRSAPACRRWRCSTPRSTTRCPRRAYLYAIPYQLYRRHKVRRYGFHGTSHRYVAHRYRQLTGRRARADASSSRCTSATAARPARSTRGDSVDTSMGFTPLEGLVMGTRSGDLDPAILDYLAAQGRAVAWREVESAAQQAVRAARRLRAHGTTCASCWPRRREHDDRRARLAIDVFCYRVRKYIGAYLAAMGGADAIVFAGGIGENAPRGPRARSAPGWGGWGWSSIRRRNAAHVGGREGRITTGRDRGSRSWVIPTDEELLIARDAYRVVGGVESRF